MSKGDGLAPRSRVCIDGFNLSLPKGSGIATYGANLSLAQKALGFETQILCGPTQNTGDNPLLDEVSLVDAVTARRAAAAKRVVDGLISPFGRRAKRTECSGEVIGGGSRLARTLADVDVIWGARDLFHAANRGFSLTGRFTPVSLGPSGEAPAADLMHWTAPLPLRARGMGNVYTIHDVVPLRLPFATLDNKKRFYALCERICAKADHVVTVSEASRQDIIRIFKIDPQRISNTYQSVGIPGDLLERSDEETARVVEGAFSLPWRRYFLFFGVLEPKKNIARLVEAYLASGVTDPLVIVGPQGWREHDAGMGQNDIQPSDRVRRFDHLPFPALVGLIRGAKATLFPSLYEGFGLPVLESMLLGTPVLTSTAGSLPEIAGDAALLVDPLDVEAIKRGIIALDADEGLREALSIKGREQAAKFSAERYRERLSALYRPLL